MNRIVVAGLGFYLLLSSSTFAGDFNAGSEPEGFRGIAWGTEIFTLPGMTLLRREPWFGGVDVYAKKDETPVMGAAPAAAVEYFFWHGRLYRGSMLTAGAESYQQLQKEIFERYGVGELQPAPAPGVSWFSWKGTITSMSLQYQETTQSGTLVMTSQKIRLRMQQDGSDTP